MKKIVSFLMVVVFLASCKKSALDNISETLPTGTVIVTGSFVSNSHPTTGTVKIVQDAAGKTQLVFENFKTDNGPDLRVWLSPNNSGSTYQEVGLLKAVTGNFSYEISSTINYTTNKRVLIWCEDFSVLFGHAILQ
jgi:Electron transfer DM13